MSQSRKITPSLESPLDKKSFLANLSMFLVKILAIPVKTDPDYTNAKFKLFSLKTIAFCVIYYGAFLGYVLNMMFQVEFIKDYMNIATELYNPFDIISAYIFFALVGLASPISLLFVASAFPKINQISMTSDLKTPKYLQTIMLSLCTLMCGSLSICLGFLFELHPRLFVYSLTTRITNIFFVPCICSCFSGICGITSVTVVASWITHVMDIFNSNAPKKQEVSWARNCLDLYQKLDKHLGPFFLFLFSVTQVMWVFTLFLAIISLYQLDQDLLICLPFPAFVLDIFYYLLVFYLVLRSSLSFLMISMPACPM